jgi:NhaP-type Na+/H+ or K+/H+ antiporter
MPESLITIFVGLAIGAIVRVSSDKEVQAAASFSNEIFMLGLLPSIIAESGYSLDKVIFFKNFWSILVFAVFGTLISALTIGFFILRRLMVRAWKLTGYATLRLKSFSA